MLVKVVEAEGLAVRKYSPKEEATVDVKFVKVMASVREKSSKEDTFRVVYQVIKSKLSKCHSCKSCQAWQFVKISYGMDLDYNQPTACFTCEIFLS